MEINVCTLIAIYKWSARILSGIVMSSRFVFAISDQDKGLAIDKEMRHWPIDSAISVFLSFPLSLSLCLSVDECVRESFGVKMELDYYWEGLGFFKSNEILHRTLSLLKIFPLQNLSKVKLSSSTLSTYKV